MTRLVSQEYGKTVNRKRVRRLMKENNEYSGLKEPVYRVSGTNDPQR
jgi:hypothetical protein